MTDISERVATMLGSRVAEASRMSAGNLSQVFLLRLVDGREVIAKHAATAGAEAEMLRAIGAKGAPTPVVFGFEDDLLVMEAIASDGPLGGSAWASLAEAMARLHVGAGEPYGWPVDHAFGAVAIRNGRTEDWPRFWGDNRLRCQVPYVDADLGRRLDRLADRLGDLVPARPRPAVLHGDLWGGNVLVAGARVSALIDPACYYGHREVDVAMLTLFDHPPERFFDALGLEAGWRDRLPIYRLWPLLVHLRLFGSGYRAQVEDALRRVGG